MLKIRKRFFTLIEMIIVITLIGVIAGALAWRYVGALDKGRAFKTETAISRLETILELSISDKPGLVENIDSTWEEQVRASPLVKDPNTLIYDGWGEKFDVGREGGEVKIRSRRYDEYKRLNP